MGRFTLAIMLVFALTNLSLSYSKSGNPGRLFKIWIMYLFVFIKYKQPRSYSQFLNFYLELSNDDPGIPAYDDNACSLECAELSPGEHCESSLKQCQCGNEPSCIGTAKPFCDKGKCKGIQELTL